MTSIFFVHHPGILYHKQWCRCQLPKGNLPSFSCHLWILVVRRFWFWNYWVFELAQVCYDSHSLEVQSLNTHQATWVFEGTLRQDNTNRMPRLCIQHFSSYLISFHLISSYYLSYQRHVTNHVINSWLTHVLTNLAHVQHMFLQTRAQSGMW